MNKLHTALMSLSLSTDSTRHYGYKCESVQECIHTPREYLAGYFSLLPAHHRLLDLRQLRCTSGNNLLYGDTLRVGPGVQLGLL